jgi:superfamily II DNA/RNA helicase
VQVLEEEEDLQPIAKQYYMKGTKGPVVTFGDLQLTKALLKACNDLEYE